jgi:nitroreductase
MTKFFTWVSQRSALRRAARFVLPSSLKQRLRRSADPMEKWKMADPQTMDDHLLGMIITHRGHRLDKATKGEWTSNKAADGFRYKSQLEAALEVSRSRKKEGDHITWAERVLTRYRIKEKDRERVLETVTPQLTSQAGDIFSLIKGRRSIRYFQAREIEKEKIEKILEAGKWAPCSGNRQAWHFVVQKVVKSGPSAKQKKEPESFDYQPLPHGTVVIYVAIDERIYPWKYAAAMDAAAAIQNMLLMAQHLGLGACWYYGGERLDQVKLRARFGLPDHYYIYSTVQLGYPAEAPEAPGRRPLHEITTFIGFDGRT